MSEAATLTEQEAPKKGPRERVLEASLELFVEKGYFNTNVPDISKQSKCSVGSIYHHFLNKEEIAGMLYEDGIKQFRNALSNSITQSSSVEDAISNLVPAFLNFAQSHRMLSRYLWLARHNEFLSSNVRRPTVVGFDKLGRQLTKIIKNGVRSGEIVNLDAEIFWSIVFGIPLSYVRDWLDGYTKYQPTEVSEKLSIACWSALKGLPA